MPKIRFWMRLVASMKQILPLILKPLTLIGYALLCLTPVTAVILYGWLNRYAAMRVEHLSGQTQMARPKLIKEFWCNFKTGIKALVILAIYTLPPTAIWMIMWWSGWEISFSKSYEEFATAPLSSILSVLYFALIIPVALLAQIRAIYLKSWRRAFDFQTLLKLRRFVPWRLFGLSLLYILGHLGWNTGMKIIPIFAEDVFKMPVDEFFADQGRVFSYYYLVSIALVAGLIIIKRQMAKIYYASLQPPISASVTPVEQKIIESKENTKQKTPRILWVLLPNIAVLMAWVGFAFSTYFGQFMHHAWLHWVNIPVLHLPWIALPF